MILSSIKYVFGYLGGCLVNAFVELLKFGVVLMLTHMMAMGFFYVWERTLIGSAEHVLRVARANSIQNNNNDKDKTNPKPSNAKYPFIVEIPMKKSNDSVQSEPPKAIKINSNEEVQATKAMQRLAAARDSDEEHDAAIGQTTSQ